MAGGQGLGVLGLRTATCLLAGLFAFLLVGSSSAAAQDPNSGTQKTFSYTGAPQSYTVPPGVGEVSVEAFGAQGASSDYAFGGLGGWAAGVVQVTPGEVLEVYVGGQGGVGAGVGGTHLNGGWNGGAFGSPNDNSDPHSTGGGGGGASDVRQAGAPCPITCADAAEQDAQYNRVVIAGGGGGAGSTETPYDGGGASCPGGVGGGLEGGSGNDSDLGCDEGGGGGTQTSGGSGGQGGWTSGEPGTRYMGGSAGGFGGGGGGGLYGGGGGGTEKRSFFGVASPKLGSGGGGGSSYIPVEGTTAPQYEMPYGMPLQTGNGLVVIDYYLWMTQNPSNGALGSTITNTATLTGGDSPTGAITFYAFGPGDSNCGDTDDAVFTDTVELPSGGGNGDFTSGGFSPDAVGTYHWDVEYSGDAENEGISLDGCEGTSTVAPASPALSTSASSGTLGDPIRDTASLTGGQGPTGQLTFEAFGPGDADCTDPPAFSDTRSVSGNGDYASADFTPTSPGDYRWTVAYSGDGNNDPVSSACNAANETSTVWLAAPLLTTNASAGIVIGGSIYDTATLSHGQSPTGTIEFALYGPGDADCTGPPAFTDAVDVNSGNGAYRSAAFAPAHAGNYRWVARYSGDNDDDPAAGACNDPRESVSVAKRSPTVASAASGDIVLGGSINDTATIADGTTPTGEVTFSLYGPDDAACSDPPVLTATVVADSGNGSYDSADFTPPEAGTYSWIAAYSGDADNEGATSACSDPGVSVTVSPPAVEITAVEVDRTGGTATLDVETNAAGALWMAKTNKVKRTDTATLTEAGSVELEVAPHSAAAQTLRRKGQLTVNPRVRFGPATGGQLGERQVLNLRLD